MRLNKGAFAYCRGIASITIPEGINTISGFWACNIYVIDNRSDLNLSIGSEDYGYIAQNAKAIINRDGTVTYAKEEGIEYLLTDDKFLFMIEDGKYKLIAYAGNESTVTLPLTVNGNEYEIYKMRGVTDVVIPYGMKKVDDYAFSSSALESIVIPKSVIYIGSKSFSNCESLTSIEIPDTVLDMGYGVFEGCKNLSSVVLPSSVRVISYNFFYGCRSLTEIIIPDGITEIGYGAFSDCTNLTSITMTDSIAAIGKYAFYNTAYYNNQDNWDDGALYIGKHLIKVQKDATRFISRDDMLCVAQDAFEGCHKLKYVEIGGNRYDMLNGNVVTNLETLVITDLPSVFGIHSYFWDIPLTLKTIILKSGVDVSNPHLFDNITGVTIYVEDAKIDCPWDHDCPGWNNGNKVFYGDEWARVKFSSDGEVIADDVYLSNQVIRPPYIADVKNEDTNRIFVGWDFDGDGQADSLPATVLGEVEANAVYRTEDATYTIEFLDKNGDVLYNYILPYGAIIPEPTAPVAAGYVFLGWDGYYAGMSATADMKIASSWSHIGGGHDYVITVILPSCTTKGYTKHECSICGDSYMTDITEETGHSFGDWIISTKPTCSDDGIKYRVCHCGYMETDVAQSTGHSYEILSEIKATCKNGGYITYKCSSCGETMTEETNMLPHNYEKKYVSKSFLQWLIEHILNILFGYEGNNAYYYKCTVCGKIADVDDSAVIRTASAQEICEHEAGDWTVDAEHSYLEIRKCGKCEKIIEARNICTHNYGEGYAYNNESHWHECSVCGDAVDMAAHELDFEWVYDQNTHWHECGICGARKDERTHAFDNSCDTTCDLCGYVRSITHNYEQKHDENSHWDECTVCGDRQNIATHVFEQVYDIDNHWDECTVCHEQKNKVMHTYELKYDDSMHWYECAICHGVVLGESHDFEYEWKYDETNHWLECSVCHDKKDITSHVFDNACDTTCDACGYMRSITHDYDQKYDENSHWDECRVCGNKQNVTAHIFDNACDTTCDACGYVRSITHSYEQKHDENNHWDECTVCGDKQNVTAHIFDNACDTTCDTCGYTRAITHNYEQKHDENSHWDECSVCHSKKDITAHIFDNACDTTCDACGYTRSITHNYEKKHDETNHWDECTVCGDRQNVTAHIFDTACDTTCDACGYVRTITHSYEQKHDGTNHWNECSACHCKKDIATHTFAQAHDESGHWSECSVCHETNGDKAAHTNTKNKHICDTCGRKLSDHEGGTATCSEKAICTICGEKYGDFAEHSFGEWKTNAEGKRTKVCSACGKVANFMYGDLNYDGKVNAIDLTILRRYLARYSSEIDIAVADFNGDGKVNTLDLMLLRRFLVGYDSVLGK